MSGAGKEVIKVESSTILIFRTHPIIAPKDIAEITDGIKEQIYDDDIEIIIHDGKLNLEAVISEKTLLSMW